LARLMGRGRASSLTGGEESTFAATVSPGTASPCTASPCSAWGAAAGVGAGAAAVGENFSHIFFTAPRTPADVMPYTLAISSYSLPSLYRSRRKDLFRSEVGRLSMNRSASAGVMGGNLKSKRRLRGQGRLLGGSRFGIGLLLLRPFVHLSDGGQRVLKVPGQAFVRWSLW